MGKRRLALQRGQPNLVTESKKYAKSTISEENRVDFLSRIRQESLRKTYNLFGHLNAILHVFRHFSALECCCR